MMLTGLALPAIEVSEKCAVDFSGSIIHKDILYCHVQKCADLPELNNNLPESPIGCDQCRMIKQIRT